MVEKIILAPGLKSNEILKSLARNGHNVINMHVESAVKLARLALLRGGVVINEDFKDYQDEMSFVAEAVNGDAYFQKPSYSDIKNIAVAIRQLRLLVTADSADAEAKLLRESLQKGIFQAKNQALLRIYDKYMALLKESNSIDSVAIIRKCISTFSKNNELKLHNLELICLKEFELSPLENFLLDTIGKNCDLPIRAMSLLDMFETSSNNNILVDVAEIPKAETAVLVPCNNNVVSVKNCYGSPNEVEDILATIYGGGVISEAGINNNSSMKLDDCTVALTDVKSYGQLFFEYSLLYNIPMSFGCGISIANSTPAKLLKLYYHWCGNGFFSKLSLLDMVNSSVFDKQTWWGVLSENVEDNTPRPNDGEKQPQEKNNTDEMVDSNDDRKIFYYRAYFLDILGDLRFTNSIEDNCQKLTEFKSYLERKEAELTAKIVASSENNPNNSTSLAPDELSVLSVSQSSYQQELADIIQKKNCLPMLEQASKELALPIEDFIKKYARIRIFSADKSPNQEYSSQLLRQLDYSAADTIYNELHIIRQSQVEQKPEDIIDDVLKMNVCKQASQGGYLHITNIDGALSVPRKNIFVVGLAASHYPGSPRDNYLILDNDIQQFGSDAAYLLSEEKVKQRKEKFFTLLNLAANVDRKLYLSYAGMNVSELKRDNASSLIFDVLASSSGRKLTAQEISQHITKVEYFSPAISANREVGKAYARGFNIKIKDQLENKVGVDVAVATTVTSNVIADNAVVAANTGATAVVGNVAVATTAVDNIDDASTADTNSTDFVGNTDADATATANVIVDIDNIDNIDGAATTNVIAASANADDSSVEIIQQAEKLQPSKNLAAKLLERQYSPSSIDVFFQCPKKFQLERLLGLECPDDDRPLEIIPANAKGSLAHSLLEHFTYGTEKKDFLLEAKVAFDDYMIQHPAVNTYEVEQYRTDFFAMMDKAYDMEQDREIILRENDVAASHESGINLHGKPDRVERLADGSCLIADFKTGTNLKHYQDDIRSCLQTMIYAYIMEQNGYAVAGGEYRYIALGQSVTCKYDAAMKKKLKLMLENFKEHLLSNTYPLADEYDVEISELLATLDDSSGASGDGNVAKNACECCPFMEICGKLNKN